MLETHQANENDRIWPIETESPKKPSSLSELIEKLESLLEPGNEDLLSEVEKGFHANLLSRSQPTYSLVGSLKTVSLQDTPKFIALSYQWAGETCEGALLLNGIKVNITQNLLSALQHFQSTNEQIPLWIDAVRFRIWFRL